MKKSAANQKVIVVVGGGAAGFFAAIHAGNTDPHARVILLEKSNHPLAKVRVSGGGRCNVTHSCFIPKKLCTFYPRGAKALLGPFTRFGPTQTVQWFADRAITLKTESDGRMFPITDNSGTIIDALIKASREAGVTLRLGCGLDHLAPAPDGGFNLRLMGGEPLFADRIILATGGNPSSRIWENLRELGHTIVPLVPSLFTFHINDPRIAHLQGLSIPEAQLRLSLPESCLKSASVWSEKSGSSSECIEDEILDREDSVLRPKSRIFQQLSSAGPLLITHWGLSGPATLKLSAFGARALHDVHYQCDLHIQWLPEFTSEKLIAHFQDYKVKHGRRHVFPHPEGSLPTRIWERLAQRCGISWDTKWSDLKKESLVNFAKELTGQGEPYKITAKSTFKEEFVTAGGIELSEVDFRTMESKKVPGLFFAGEVLDIDGVTGGFNFQAAWTTGFTAGSAAGTP